MCNKITKKKSSLPNDFEAVEVKWRRKLAAGVGCNNVADRRWTRRKSPARENLKALKKVGGNVKCYEDDDKGGGSHLYTSKQRLDFCANVSAFVY